MEEVVDYSDFSLETKSLVLKKAKEEDWEEIYKNLWSHKESAKYMLWDVTTSETEAINRIRRTVDFQKVNKYAFFVYEKNTNIPIGFAGMKEIEPGVYEDIGIALGPDYTRKGYGIEILNALVEEAKSCGGHKFVASCRKQNIASHQLQMRCGFHFVSEETRIDPRTGESYLLEINEKQLDK
ncbi:MAG: GNAT family N-acetyltransferase [Lachnospiraceae bacterium]|nr:GNAT family N-acetyltransferase [Lachnospiraceae bacterium]